MRIVEGYYAKQHQLKYQVHVKIVQNKRSVNCGGSIIHEQFVVSAAHCFVNKIDNKFFPIKNVIITAGTSNLREASKEIKKLEAKGLKTISCCKYFWCNFELSFMFFFDNFRREPKKFNTSHRRRRQTRCFYIIR